MYVPILSGVEAGSNTSTVDLRIVESDEKETRWLGGITGPHCHWES
jgi:hypothetical protein